MYPTGVMTTPTKTMFFVSNGILYGIVLSLRRPEVPEGAAITFLEVIIYSSTRNSTIITTDILITGSTIRMSRLQSARRQPFSRRRASETEEELYTEIVSPTRIIMPYRLSTEEVIPQG